jgi:tripartite ATP-independent transporter DctP family solute receptor
MKRTLMIFCAIIVIAGSGYAGGGQEASAGSGAKTYSFRIASADQPGSSIVQSDELFLQLITERTGGAITGQVFAASQLGSHRDYIDGLQMGSIQAADITAAVLSTVAPRFAIFDLPYISKSPQALYTILDGKAGEILTAHIMESAKIRTLGWIVRTPRHVYSAKGPINTVEDFRNLKIRTMESSPMLKAMALFNAKATAIPTAERYMALQTGVVEAAENSVAEIYNCKEFEVTKYVSKTAHLVTPNIISMGTGFLESLPADYQKIVIEAGREAGSFGTQFEINAEKEFEQKLISEGKMIFNEVQDKSSFVNRLASLYAEYTSVIGQDLITLFQNQ